MKAKKVIGIVVCIVVYILLFWVFPFCTVQPHADWIIVPIAYHIIFVVCGVFCGILAWAFDWY